MESSKITVLIADDHQVFRDGLNNFLSSCPDFKVVGEAEDGVALVEKALALLPDVIITDITMPLKSGIEATKELCQQIPYCKIVILSVDASEDTLIEAIDAGVLGYMLKNADTNEIRQAVYTISKYKPYFCKNISDVLTNIISRRLKVPAKETVVLTEREIEIIRMLCEEYTSKAIAYSLNLSKRTVEGHRTRIMDKIGAKSVAGIITYAFETGIYKKDS